MQRIFAKYSHMVIRIDGNYDIMGIGKYFLKLIIKKYQNQDVKHTKTYKNYQFKITWNQD